MLASLLRQLAGRAKPAPATAPESTHVPGIEAGLLRERVHPLLRAGDVSGALTVLAPQVAAGSAGEESRALCEFAVSGIAGLAQDPAWRGEITYMLGAILLAQGDDEGARLCAAVVWGDADAAQGYRRFSRGRGIYDYCRDAGLPAERYDGLAIERMDRLPLADAEREPTSLCMLPQGRVLGLSFLPASSDGAVFTERCAESAPKLERLGGIAQFDILRLACTSALWTTQAVLARHAGRHVLLGNHENIGHWLLFYFARLRVVERMPALRDARFVVGERVLPVHLECLRRAGVAEERLVRVPKGTIAEFEELWVPSMVCGVTALRSIYWTPGLAQYLRATLGAAPPKGGGKRRLFLVRGAARWRRLVNEGEVVAALAQHGFEAVDAGTLDLQQQIDLAAEAEAIVSCLGAATNLHLFAGEGVPVIQLQPEKHVRMNLTAPIAKSLGQPFRSVGGEVRVAHADPLKSDYAVAPGEVVEVVLSALRR